jgi:hypothetical protein
MASPAAQSRPPGAEDHRDLPVAGFCSCLKVLGRYVSARVQPGAHGRASGHRQRVCHPVGQPDWAERSYRAYGLEPPIGIEPMTY